jgi:hypothetical protein
MFPDALFSIVQASDRLEPISLGALEEPVMDDASASERLGCCPHVDRNDQRCSHRFSVSRLEQAFSVCFGSFQHCPMYHHINTERAKHKPAARRLPLVEMVEMTAHGRSIPLRATGT